MIRKKYLVTLRDMEWQTDCKAAPNPAIGLTPYYGVFILYLSILVVSLIALFIEFGIGSNFKLMWSRMVKVVRNNA